LRVLAGESRTRLDSAGHHIAFHADHLGDVRDLARAVAQAGSLDDDVDRAEIISRMVLGGSGSRPS
jgi:hypothetical protein